MRVIPVAVLFALLASRVAAQTFVKISFAFEGLPQAATTAPSEAQSVLTDRSLLRAWADSVDVFLDQVVQTAQPQGWLRARAGETPNYSVQIVGLPIRSENCATANVTAYSIVVFEPGTGGQWKYVQALLGYDVGAQHAAGAIFKATVDAINRARTNVRPS